MLKWPLRVIILGILASGCASPAPEPRQGSERGPCFADGTCNAGLECLSEVCVQPPVTDAGTPLNDPPQLDLLPNGTDSFDVVVHYKVANAEPADDVQVTALRWRDEASGATGPISLSARTTSQGIGACPTSSTGARAQTIWDSLKDVGYGNNRLVTVEVTVSDGNASATARSQPFFLNNGPVLDQALSPTAGPSDGFDVADVTSDGRPDLVSCRTHGPTRSGGVTILVGRGPRFDLAQLVSPPVLAGTFPNSGSNPLLYDRVHPGICAAIDADDSDAAGKIDLLLADQFYAPNSDQPLARNVSAVLNAVAADAANGFSNVMAHQVTLTARQASGLPDVANAIAETALASVSDMAPLVRFAGQPASPYPFGVTGDPTLDRYGWMVQDLQVANLDPPVTTATPGSLAAYQTARAGFEDVVMIDAFARLGSTLGSGDTTGSVVIRQFDPATRRLGRAFYLDPIDMGRLPTTGAVGDLLWTARSSLGAPAYMIGARDIVVANTGSSSLTFYFQLSPSPGSDLPPTFASYQLALRSLPVAGFSTLPDGDTVGVAIGDLNGDGANDLVVVGELSKTAVILLWDADPGSPGSILPLTGGVLPLRVAEVKELPSPSCGRPAIGDVTGDARSDLIIPCRAADETLLYANRGHQLPPAPAETPAFQRVRFAAGGQPYGVITSDVNGDRLEDVVVANHLTGAFSVHHQATPGSLDEQFVPVATGSGPSLLAAGDLDGDGSPEILVPNAGDNTIGVYARDPVQVLRPVHEYSTAASGGSAPVQARVVDMTGDGLNDAFVTLQFVQPPGGGIEGGFAVIPSPLAELAAAPSTPLAPSAQAGAVGDVDKDGFPDVVLVSAEGDSIALFSASSTPFTYSVTSAVHSGRAPRQVQIGDLDGDGWDDLAVSVRDALFVFYNRADGTFDLSAPTVFDTSAMVDPDGLAVGDLNADGALDILCGDVASARAAVFFHSGGRSFTPVPLAAGAPASGVAIGDLNDDGLSDAAMAWTGSNQVGVFAQKAAPAGLDDTLLPPVVYPTASAPHGVVVADVDGDGRSDLVVSARGASSLNLFLQR